MTETKRLLPASSSTQPISSICLPTSTAKLPAAFCADKLEAAGHGADVVRSEEPTSELQSLMRISYAVFCLKKQLKPYRSRCAPYRRHTTSSVVHQTSTLI